MAYTILIVDDNVEEMERQERVFKSGGFTVLLAHDGAEGVAVATEKHPDIILTGIVLPKMDGFGMIGQLQANHETKSIPVMIYSHMGKKDDEAKAQAMGVRDFLTAGFITPRELLSLAILRIEGEKGVKKYLLDVNETAMDAAKLTQDFSIRPYLKCEKHDKEKMVLRLVPDLENIGEFRAKFICPQEK